MVASLFLSFFILLWTPASPNVLFMPRGAFYASYDHWTLHFPIETRTSWTFSTKLEYRISAFKSTFATKFAESRPKLRDDLAERLWGKFIHHAELLDTEMNVTIDSLRHLKRPDPARTKRSLLPFVGDAMSSLFGVATTSEIQEILSRVNDLSDDRDGILNVLDNTVTMINATVVDVSMNRDTINRLTNVTHHLTKRIDSLKNAFLDTYSASTLESHIDAVFEDLMTTVRDFRKNILDMETIISFTENGILPRSFLPPSRFSKVLDDIQKTLPRDMALPFDPVDTDKYYSTVRTQTFRTNAKISVILNIPLLSVSDHFNVFQIFNVPVPKSFNEQNFVANYEIEKAKFVALSEDSLKFMFIDDDDVHVYLRKQLPFCPIRRPVTSVLTSTLCIPALLTNDTDKVTRSCENIIHMNRSVDPTAEYLGNGNWLIISAKPLNVEIRCKVGQNVNSTRMMRTVLPLSLVKLDFGCAAFTSYFQLPIHHRTDSSLKPYQISHLNRTLTLNHVWTNIETRLLENNISFDHLTKILPSIQTTSVTLSAIKQHVKFLKKQAHNHHWTVIVPAMSLSSVAICGIIMLVLWKCTRCPRFKPSFLNAIPSRQTLPNPGFAVDDQTLRDVPRATTPSRIEPVSATDSENTVNAPTPSSTNQHRPTPSEPDNPSDAPPHDCMTWLRESSRR